MVFRTRSSGFTLLEMLVTLVLFSLVSVLLWQAMAWMARIEDSLAEARAFSTQQALRLEWVRGVIGGAVSGPRGDPRKYQGEAQRILAYTVASPWPEIAGPLWLELKLERIEGEQRLVAESPGRSPMQLLAWEGQGAFAFLDRDGKWREEWPAKGAASEDEDGLMGVLPQAVKLAGLPEGEMVVAIQADALLLPSRLFQAKEQ